MENVIRKIEALLNTNGCSEAEAEARLAKAQELLERYNLDMANIGSTKKGAQRKDTKTAGGLYSWQRKLWKSTAELNFCYYVSIKGLKKGSTYEHRVIGSHANVIATQMMARYLQETIERLAQQWAKDNFYKSVFVREAIAYREGMAARISERLNARRQEVVAEERRKEEERKREQARNAAAPSTNALTILDVISTEADLNNDYLNDWEPGTTARRRREQQAAYDKWYADYQERQRKQREWDEAHPEEAAARKKKEREELERWAKREARNAARRKGTSRYRRPTAEEERMGLGSYYEGRAKGNEVSIDQQINENAVRRIK